MGEAGSQLSDLDASKGQCNAKHPGWLNGDHPEELGDTVERQFCFNMEDQTKAQDGKVPSTPVSLWIFL